MHKQAKLSEWRGGGSFKGFHHINFTVSTSDCFLPHTPPPKKNPNVIYTVHMNVTNLYRAQMNALLYLSSSLIALREREGGGRQSVNPKIQKSYHI